MFSLRRERYLFPLLLYAVLFFPGIADSASCVDAADGRSVYEVAPWYPMPDADLRPIPAPAKRLPGDAFPEEPGDDALLTERRKTGSWESELIAALADFVADRTQSEIVFWLVGDVMGAVCVEDEAGMKRYFPNLCALRHSYETSSYFPVTNLITAFRQDMENLPPALLCDYFGDDRGYYIAAILRNVRYGIEPKNLIAGLAEHDVITRECRNELLRSEAGGRHCSLYFTGSFVQAYLKSLDREERHIDWSLFSRHLRKKLEALQQGLPGDHALSSLTRILDSVDAHKEQFTQIAVEIHYLVRDIRVHLEKIALARSSGTDRLFDILPNAMQISHDLVLILEKIRIIFPGLETDSLSHSLHAMSMMMSGRYADAILDLRKLMHVRLCAHILDTYSFSGNTSFDCRGMGSTRDVIEHLAVLEKQGLLTAGEGRQRSGERSEEPLIQDLKKKAFVRKAQAFEFFADSLSFVSVMASARTRDDMKKALADAASPIGGWRLRKAKKDMFSISALVGVQVSSENTAGAGWGWASGLFAPVGFDWTTNRWNSKYISSLGLFGSAIDLGNLLNARLTGTDDAHAPEMNIKQIISPGIYARAGFPKSPGVWGLGYSYTPYSRAVEAGGGEEVKGSHRIIMFLAIDTVLFYLK